ncbi:hypothetical protein [Streptomyces sp. NPDC001450]
MSQEETGADAPADERPPEDGERKEEESEGQERQRQEAWAARQALIQHGPSFVMTLDRPTSTSRIGRDQFGVSGGTVHGDVNYYVGGPTERPEHVSGVIRPEELTDLADVFRGCASFDEALARLRTDKVVVLSGGRDTGRRSAALMLLHRAAGGTVRSLVQPRSPSALLDQLDSADGYLLLNFATDRSNPLRESHMLGLRERLERSGGHLVITVEPSAALDDVPFVRWEPPSTEEMLHAHVTPHVGEAGWQELCGRAPVKEFLTRQHQPAAIAEFTRRLVAVHRGESDEQELAAYSEQAIEAQVTRWLTDDQRELRDKAFLISLAVFDKAPYAVSAELADVLYTRLQYTADPRRSPVIPVFGSSREDRLRLAHADGYHDTEVTEWGSLVGRFFAEFRDEKTAQVLLEAVWNLHPSARTALVKWIDKLAEDGRPLVRTRAASATALLTKADFSSAMAHLIEPWADGRDPNSWLTAANALTMAHLLRVPTVLPVLRDWCTGKAESRRWTAIRAYGLLGPVVHEETLDALLEAVRQDPDPTGDDGEPTEGGRQFTDAFELLLLAVREPVLSALAERLSGDRTVRAYAVRAFLQACGQKEEPDDRPVILHWYAQAVAADDMTTARQLAAFWEQLLADRACGTEALRTLRGWVRRADGDPETESALVSLLPAITTTSPNDRRVGHLLRTLRDSPTTLSPAAGRLLDRLSRR